MLCCFTFSLTLYNYVCYYTLPVIYVFSITIFLQLPEYLLDKPMYLAVTLQYQAQCQCYEVLLLAMSMCMYYFKFYIMYNTVFIQGWALTRHFPIIQGIHCHIQKNCYRSSAVAVTLVLVIADQTVTKVLLILNSSILLFQTISS